jgi:hypothetical protein
VAVVANVVEEAVVAKLADEAVVANVADPIVMPEGLIHCGAALVPLDTSK